MNWNPFKRPALLITIGLACGLLMLAHLVYGDALYPRRMPRLLRILPFAIHFLVLPFVFALAGSLLCRKRPFPGACLVLFVPICGAVVGSSVIYFAAPRLGLIVSPNYYTPQYMISNLIRLIPYGLAAIAWAFLIACLAAFVTRLINRNRTRMEK